MDSTERTISHIADNPTRLKDLDGDKLEEVGLAYVFDELKGEMKNKVGLYRIKYEDEKGKFLSKHGYYTARNYLSALGKMEEYAVKIGKSPLELTFQGADDFILSFSSHCSPGVTRLVVAGCSSFFTFLERRYDVIRNPFRGTGCRPKKRNVRKLELPTEGEIEEVIRSSTGALRVGMVMIRDLGLRVGALPELSVRNGRWKTRSKGKEINGEVTKRIMEEIRKQGLNMNHPFEGYDDEKIKDDMNYLIRKCWKEGKIKTRFSPHDIRHVKAVRDYEESKDIIKVRDMLKHSSVAVTEMYLRGLGLV